MLFHKHWLCTLTFTCVTLSVYNFYTRELFRFLFILFFILLFITLFVFQPDDGLWYRPKYCIIGVENNSSRISLNLELVHLYNTGLKIKKNLTKVYTLHILEGGKMLITLKLELCRAIQDQIWNQRPRLRIRRNQWRSQGGQPGICPPGPSAIRQALGRECTLQADQRENGNLQL